MFDVCRSVGGGRDDNTHTGPYEMTDIPGTLLCRVSAHVYCLIRSCYIYRCVIRDNSQ